MLFKIIDKQELNSNTAKITVEAPLIANKAKAGQFVVLVIDETGERVPLTLAGWDNSNGTITLIFQRLGFSTKKLGALKAGDYIAHILGPLGHPTEIITSSTVVCVGAGVGIAEVYPVSMAFKEAGNRVISIIGTRSKDLLILENQMGKISDELFISTDDGSYGHKGFVIDVLKDLLKTIEKSSNTRYPELVYAVGPVPMMQAAADLTRNYNIKTIVSLNPIMVDATGMCASCRCTVDGKTVYGCVDGPDFDAHKVDFDELQKRLKLFVDEENKIL
ncbi:MAG: sulfide/dihydroorotate dehydrogenase-like FAD/NAD-binding protein [Candidatus Omnitrophota bacterium]